MKAVEQLEREVAHLRSVCALAKATILAAKAYIPDGEIPHRWCDDALAALRTVEKTTNEQ
jgi:hypothetical protein